MLADCFQGIQGFLLIGEKTNPPFTASLLVLNPRNHEHFFGYFAWEPILVSQFGWDAFKVLSRYTSTGEFIKELPGLNVARHDCACSSFADQNGDNVSRILKMPYKS